MKKNIKILLVENDTFACEEAEEYLSLIYDTVLIAHDGEEGLKLYEEEKPDILIVDHIMPKLQGLAMIRCIRETNKQIPIILTTSDTSRDSFYDSTDLQLVKYLIKPIGNKKFKDVLNYAENEFLKGKHSFIIIDKDENLIYDNFNKVLKVNDEIIKLSNNERIFLELLLEFSHKVVAYDEIFKCIWKDQSYGDGFSSADKDRTRSLVSTLRKKTSKLCIENTSGLGYQISVNS